VAPAIATLINSIVDQIIESPDSGAKATRVLLSHIRGAMRIKTFSEIGSPYHGRDVDGTKGLIGYFVNVLPLRHE
jgi:hypothetical protein